MDYRRTWFQKPGKIHDQMDGWVYRTYGRFVRRKAVLKKLDRQARAVMAASENLKELSNKDLYSEVRTTRQTFRRQAPDSGSHLEMAMALLVEAAERTLGLRPFKVQIMGALAMHKGMLAEMATGEGKSLTACLPAVLAAWTGRPCHIVTVNGYLARRDAVEMKSFYTFCDVSAGCVTAQMSLEDRRKNYSKGVVYTTSKELVADFLRDRLALGPLASASRRQLQSVLIPGWNGMENVVMRGLDTVIVDEADSVLIDEAVTPLIISRTIENRHLTGISMTAGQLASCLEPGIDYRTDIKFKEVYLKPRGIEKIEKMSEGFPGIWKAGVRSLESVKQAISAREFFKQDKQYIVLDDKIVIVDEFTGRMMPNRSWSQGLHQAVEAKEGVEITNPTETLSRLSFQQFFRLFRKISGMTGTAMAAADEFWHIYGLPVVTIPTHKPCKRVALPAGIFSDEYQKYTAVVEDVKALSGKNRPVLIGTRSVQASEKLAAILTREGLNYNLLNAVQHESEARIVAAAGEPGRITIATNMAGRGTDIKLGKNVDALGGLHVIATEMHESPRVDRQLSGRCARQGDHGSTRSYFCMEDELFLKFTRQAIRRKLEQALGKGIPGGQLMAEKTLRAAQKKAQNHAFQQRKNVLKMDVWLEESLAFTGGSLHR